MKHLKDLQVSVVLPIHNAGPFILNTLSSIFENRRVKIELLCILDCTTDDTEMEIEQFRRTKAINGSISIWSTNFGSVALARNFGIEKAKTKYVSFVDHDDLVEPTIYEKLLTKAFLTESDVVRCGFTYKGKDFWYPVTPFLSRVQYALFGIFVWNGIYDVRLLRDHNIRFKPGYGEDYEFNLHIAYTARKVSWVRENLYHWMQHDEQFHLRRNTDDFLSRIDSIAKTFGSSLNRDPNLSSELLKFCMDHYWYFVKTRGLTHTVNTFYNDPNFKNLLRSSYNYRFSNRLAKGFHSKTFFACVTVTYLAIEWLRALVQKVVFARLAIKIVKKSRVRMNTHINSLTKWLRSIFRKLVLQQIWYIIGRENLLHSPSIVAFLVPNVDCISGGIISLFALGEETRTLFPNNKVVFFSMPGRIPVTRYTLFPNSEMIYSFKTLLKMINAHKVSILHIPEVMVTRFVNHMAELDRVVKLKHVNILNQNIELMPTPKTIARLHNFSDAVTQTTAHEKYSTLKHAQIWKIPSSHISTYIHPERYKQTNFYSKRNVILLSHDFHFRREDVTSFLINNMTGYEVRIVLGMTYSAYLEQVQNSKFVVTLGEGLDNYFIESVFTGGIPFAIFSPNFMPDNFLKLDNVAASSDDFLDTIDRITSKCNLDNSYYKELWKQNYQLLSNIYSHEVHRNKLEQFYKGTYDWSLT